MNGENPKIVPFALKDAPALIERLLPVQKLSAEAYKEQMAVHGRTLTVPGKLLEGSQTADPEQGVHPNWSSRLTLSLTGLRI